MIADKMRQLLGDKCQNWIKGHYRKITPEGRLCYCLKGALIVSTDKGERLENSRRLLKAIDSVFPRTSPYFSWGTVEGFNDSSDRKHEDILKVLDKFAELEKAEAA